MEALIYSPRHAINVTSIWLVYNKLFIKNLLVRRYSEITNRIRALNHNFDDAIAKWQQFEKKLYSVKQFIDRYVFLVLSSSIAVGT